MFRENYNYFKISSILRGDFRKQTHPLYVQILTTNQSQTIVVADRNILNTQSESKVIVLGMDGAFHKGMRSSTDAVSLVQREVQLLVQTYHLANKG
jgi:hypothetical protein